MLLQPSADRRRDLAPNWPDPVVAVPVTEMILRHYSARPLEFDENRVYERDVHFKPNGLWLSVVGDGDWKEWCEAEEFHLAALAYHCDFALAADADVLHISTARELREFGRHYRSQKAHHDSLWSVDWAWVARDYGGIIIAPYQFRCRFDKECFWYYPWDCASACIWDLENIMLDISDVDESVKKNLLDKRTKAEVV